ncbi:MAG: hypothetical protein ACJ8CR_13115 [Roseiflexaceae bacterium]
MAPVKVFVQGIVSPFEDIYEGITQRNSTKLGRGLIGFEVILGSARLMRYVREFPVRNQVPWDCFQAAKRIASARWLPRRPGGISRILPNRPGIYDPMLEKYGLDSPRHAAVRNINGTTTDPSVLDNIRYYFPNGQIPADLLRYKPYNTFNPAIYDYLLTRFYEAWRSSFPGQAKPANPEQIPNWDNSGPIDWDSIGE